MRVKAFLLIVICSGFICASAQQSDPNEIVHGALGKRLDSLFSEMNRYDEFNGNVLIAAGSNILLRKCYGWQDRPGRRPLRTGSVFNLASVSKQFTAAAVMLLVKQGLLSINDPLAKYIPELAYLQGVTISHLLHHTSGLPDYTQLFEKDWPADSIVDNNLAIREIQRRQPAAVFPPGTKWQYSNTGYLLLASVVERVSGIPFDRFLRERIFRPLQMDHTDLLFVHARKLNVADLALPLLTDSADRAYVRKLDGAYGQGRVHSTIDDLYRWDRALKNNKLLTADDQRVLYASARLESGEETNYGWGWFLGADADGGRMVYHTGSWPGYLTLLERHLTSDKTVIILQNDALGTGKRRLPVDQVHDILDDRPIMKDYRLAESSLKPFIGQYKSEKGTITEIVLKHRSLWVRLNGGMEFDLIPVSESKFRVNGFMPEVTYTFSRDQNGDVEKYRMEQPEQGVDRTSVKVKSGATLSH